MKVIMLNLGPLRVNSYLVINEETKEAFIVDPGGDADKVYEVLKEEDASLKAILLTHVHYDHTGAVNTLKKELKPLIYVSAEEGNVMADIAYSLNGDVDEADVYFRDGDILEVAGINVKAILTPGHTIGGACFYIEEENLLFAGDTLFAGSVGRSDFPGGSESKLIRAIKEKLLILPEDTKVLPGHMSATTIGYEKIHNPFVQ